jgi:hypothetical protein
MAGLFEALPETRVHCSQHPTFSDGYFDLQTSRGSNVGDQLILRSSDMIDPSFWPMREKRCCLSFDVTGEVNRVLNSRKMQPGYSWH